MKIYTRKGDDGTTGLVTGARVLKSDPRVELYGTSDELNSVIGLALSQLPESEPAAPLRADLIIQQNVLFELGSELAGFSPAGGACVILDSDIVQLEESVDRWTAVLEPMRAFILPGGHAAAATLHIARTVCRRLERGMVHLRSTGDQPADARPVAPGGSELPDVAGREVVRENALKYVNRLSDYLFVAARYANHLAGIPDIKWASRAKKNAR